MASAGSIISESNDPGDDDLGNDPLPKKRRLSLSRGKKKEAPSRFTLSTDEEVEAAAKGVVPANTTRANDWARRNFQEWIRVRNEGNPLDQVPEGLLSCNEPEIVCKWIQKFVLETRQESGAPYPPKSLYAILCGLYRISQSNGVSFNFLDKKDTRFAVLHKTLDSVFSNLHSQGVGAAKKSAEVIPVEEEEMLLDSKVLSMDDPESLLNMVFFYVGLHCCLRGGQEHRSLLVNQFTRFPPDTSQYNEETYYQYTEYISKNNQHRFKDVHSKNKTVKVFALVGSRKCLVKILDFYFTKLPSEPVAFYLRPLTKIPNDPERAWYANVPIGVNTLRTMMSKISQKGNLSTTFTNHSLRATSASRLFASNVPEKLIQEKTGHRSLAGLRAYEQTTTKQQQNITKVLESAEMPEASAKENVNPVDMKPTEDKTKSVPSAPVFSGQLQNCIFNFYSN